MPHAETPLWTLEEYAWATYTCFLIGDIGALERTAPTVLSGHELLIADPLGLICATGATDFYPLVRVERWETAPPPAPEEWDLTGEAVIHHTGGTRIDVLTASPEAVRLPLGPPGPYRVRAHSRGRAEARRHSAEEYGFRGVEVWLLQFWPDVGSAASEAAASAASTV